MYKETNLRTILKTISWRITATSTTIIIVYIFTGQIDTAIEVGLLEMLAKMVIYYLHERGWDKLKFGRMEIPSYVVWITGIPFSGKTTVADLIADGLKKEERKYERLDSHTVRKLFPEVGHSRKDVNSHIKRVGHLASILESNGIVAIASFVTPFSESRDFVRSICNHFIEVHLDTDVTHVKKYDKKGFFEKAESGEITDVPGVSIEFERSEKTEMVINMRQETPQSAAKKVLKYIKKEIG